MTPEHMSLDTSTWLARKRKCFNQRSYCSLGHSPLTGDYLISQDRESIIAPPCPHCREKLTSLPDGRIGQRKLDDWKPFHRFYAAVAKSGSHKIVEHWSQSVIGSSEALVSQSPRSTFLKLYTGPTKIEDTWDSRTRQHMYVSSLGIIPLSCDRCSQTATESVAARSRAIDGDLASANIRVLLPRIV